MAEHKVTRRKFVRDSAVVAAGVAAGLKATETVAANPHGPGRHGSARRLRKTMSFPPWDLGFDISTLSMVRARFSEVGRAIGFPLQDLHSSVAIGVLQGIAFDFFVAAGVVDDEVGDVVLSHCKTVVAWAKQPIGRTAHEHGGG